MNTCTGRMGICLGKVVICGKKEREVDKEVGVVIPKAMFAQKHEGGSQTEPATDPADCRKPSRGMKTRKEM